MSHSENKQIKVVVCGLCRTGTTTLSLTLNKLGFQCYDGQTEFFSTFGKHDMDFFVDLANKTQSKDTCSVDWNQLFKRRGGFNACSDYPMAHFWKELSIYYPHAKFILTTRNDENWWMSCYNTIFYGGYSIRMILLRDIILPLLRKKSGPDNKMDFVINNTFGRQFHEKYLSYAGKNCNKQKCMKIFNDHNKNVKKYFEKENKNRLFILDWESEDKVILLKEFCKFLNVSVPKDMNTFEKTNTSTQVNAIYDKLIKRELILYMYEYKMFIAFIIACFAGCVFVFLIH
eukprot:384315_1